MVNYDDYSNNDKIQHNTSEKTHPQIFSRKQTKNLQDHLEESIKTQDSCLKIYGTKFNKFPDTIENFHWVEILDIFNNKLKFIDESFLLFSNLKTLEITYNEIEFVDGCNLPDSLKILKLQCTGILKVINLKEGLQDIDLSDNNLQNDVLEIPASVTKLDLSNNENLMRLPHFKSKTNLTKLDISKTNIRSIDELPDSINILYASNCNINTISKFPSCLMEFSANESKIFTIDAEFPPDLFELEICGNTLKTIPKLSQNIHSVDLSNNCLEKIPEFSDGFILQKLNLTMNPKLNVDEIKEFEKQNPFVDFKYDDEYDISNHMGIFSNDIGRLNRLQYHHYFNDNFNNNSHSHSNHYLRSCNSDGNSENSNPQSSFGYKSGPSFTGKFTKSNPYYIVHKSVIDA